MESAQVLFRGLSGYYGSIGLFGAFERVFLGFALLSGPASFILDAPFGRFLNVGTGGTVNGDVGWLLMEIVSPLSFLLAACTPLSSSSGLGLHIPTIMDIERLAALPTARIVLVGLYFCHYLNRSIISTWRNPGRARMHLSVPLSAVAFNLMNGSLLGTYLTSSPPASSASLSSGLNPSTYSLPLFLFGISLFVLGFAGNIISDEILYALKRTTKDPSQRYAIPHGFLYSRPFGGVSQPSFFTEWIEWSGFVIACLALAPGTFPGGESRGILREVGMMILGRKDVVRTMMRDVPMGLRPFQAWYLQPPMLFLMNEFSAMLPRAISTHKWYRKTFSTYPPERKVVIPGIF